MNSIYKCTICGNIVEKLYDSGVSMVCCGKEMTLLKENTQDASKEKHVPVIEKTPKGIKVKIGSIPHPMEPEHFIQWIEVISDGKSYKEFLKPGMKPEAEFCLSEKVIAREYCNLHGLWKSSS